MLEDEIDLIAVQVEEGFFSKDLLRKLIKKATSPFTLKKDGYTTVVSSDGATCASVAALMAVDNVLNDKRKADEISMIEAKRRKLNGKKTRTPNTTRGYDGFTVATNLEIHDNTNDEGVLKKKKNDMEKEIAQQKTILTEWGKLIQKRQVAAIRAGVGVAEPSLWAILTPGNTTRAERQLFLRMCVPKSGKLGKDESEQIECLHQNNVTYLRLMAAKETIELQLTSNQKAYDEQFLSESQANLRSQSSETAKNDCINDEEWEEILINIDEEMQMI